jgi:excisionase family DNA binding protein
MSEQYEYLTTGQAAKLCMVTPDTILKWVKQGRIPSRRTAGGHYRIRRDDLEQFRAAEQVTPDAIGTSKRNFQYCWEYNTDGETLPDCLKCVVFATRAYRCYELLKAAPEIGHGKLFCKKSCEECDYYLNVHKDPTNVLVVSDNQVLIAALERDASTAAMNLRVTNCEYTTSAEVQSFRPDYAIVDCSLGTERSRDIVFHLKQDPRIPYVRVILAAEDGAYPTGCEKDVFARIETPFQLEDVTQCIDGVRPISEEGLDTTKDEGSTKEQKVASD